MNISYIFLGVALIVVFFVLPSVMYKSQHSRYADYFVLITGGIACLFIALGLATAFPNKV